MDTGKRLARLEEQLYFQEHAIQELNDALLAQQRQMDAMEHALKIMAELFDVARGADFDAYMATSGAGLKTGTNHVSHPDDNSL